MLFSCPLEVQMKVALFDRLYKLRDKPIINYLPSSFYSLDGAVALIMALDRSIRNKGDGGSVYDERGLLTI
jgi:hypothetical protein